MRFLARARVLLCALLLIAVGSVVNAAMAQAASACKGSQAVSGQSISDKIAADQSKLDINTATAAQLKALPGIGDAYAARIIAGRPYTLKTQLASRGILTKAVYSGISDQIIAHRPKK